MNWLECTGLAFLTYAGISFVVAIILLLVAYIVAKEDFPRNGIWRKMPLILLFTMMTWPLLICQVGELSFDGSGY